MLRFQWHSDWVSRAGFTDMTRGGDGVGSETGPQGRLFVGRHRRLTARHTAVEGGRKGGR